MLAAEQAQTVHEIMAKAAREFAIGDDIQGSKTLWSAAVHAITAVARDRGWEHGDGDRDALRNAIRRLAAEDGKDDLIAGFGVADSFRANAFIGYMSQDAIEFARPGVERFIARLLSL